jgi:glucose-6-phosphate 1-dehydrogenase
MQSECSALVISSACEPEPNRLRLRLSPEESIDLTLQARSEAVALGTAKTSLVSSESYRPDEQLDAYARIFDDARRGDHTHFASRDVVEASWRVLDSVVHRTTSPAVYAQRSAGPDLP